MQIQRVKVLIYKKQEKKQQENKINKFNYKNNNRVGKVYNNNIKCKWIFKINKVVQD